VRVGNGVGVIVTVNVAVGVAVGGRIIELIVPHEPIETSRAKINKIRKYGLHQEMIILVFEIWRIKRKYPD
jgi:phosphopantetheine adenylyltransferase